MYCINNILSSIAKRPSSSSSSEARRRRVGGFEPMILAIATGGGQGRERQGYSDDAGWSVEIGIYRNVHMCRRTYVRIRAHARYLLVNDMQALPMLWLVNLDSAATRRYWLITHTHFLPQLGLSFCPVNPPLKIPVSPTPSHLFCSHSPSKSWICPCIYKLVMCFFNCFSYAGLVVDPCPRHA